MSDTIGRSDPLRREGAALARYILGRDAPEQAVARYGEGCRHLFAGHVGPADAAMLPLVLSQRWSLPCLDAAAGLLLPRSLLRQKLILMLAILETMPELADDFLPRERPRLGLVLGLVASGAATGLKTIMGMLILPVARWAP